MSFLPGIIAPLSLLVFATIRNIRDGLNLGDEGYLVYGTQALLRGEVPIRDFRAYDPARYYWCALWFRLLGPGFLTIRISMAVISAFSSVLIVLLVGHATGSPLVAAMAGCVSLVWMMPRHKQIEIFFSIVCCGVMYGLISGIGSPFALGMLGAVALTFGLNIFAYFLGSAVLVLLSGVLPAPLSTGVQFTAGLIAACIALLLWAASARGFLQSYLDRKILALLRRGTTNLPLLRPWLWAASVPQLQHHDKRRRFALRLVFTLIPVVCAVVMVGTAVTPGTLAANSKGLAFAAACTGLVYFHHVYSRADLAHFSQVIHPVLILVAALSQAIFGVAGSAFILLLVFTASVALLRREAEFPLRNLFNWSRLPDLELTADRVLLPRATADNLNRIREIIEAQSDPGDTLFAAPNCPGFLALSNRHSAVYDTFPVYPSTQEARTKMIHQFKTSNPKVAIISKAEVDGRRDLSFVTNYAELATYISENYQAVLETASETVFVRH